MTERSTAHDGSSRPSPEHIVMYFTECAPGAEEDFNRWYDEEHIPELMKVDGVLAIRRFELVSSTNASTPNRWLEICEITGSLEAWNASMDRLRPTRSISPHYVREKTVKYQYSAITPR